MANERIKLEMTGEDIIKAMGGSNIGAITVCLRLLQHGRKVDPDSLLDGGFSSLLNLDMLKIYEERIWMLFKYVCNQHLGKMIAVLRAQQLGGLAGVNTQTLNHAINNRSGDSIDLDAVVEAVKNRMPNFNPEAVAA